MNRIWTYIIGKTLNQEQLHELLQKGQEFVSDWTAHENKLAGSFEILYGRILLVKVNEEVNGASGCSIDKLTRFIKDTERNFDTELLNRMLVAYRNGEKLEVVHASRIKDLLLQGQISENTVVLNTAAANEQELKHWEKPLKDTWLRKYLGSMAP